MQGEDNFRENSFLSEITAKFYPFENVTVEPITGLSLAGRRNRNRSLREPKRD